ncbi:MAG: LysM domain-containing protein [Acidobacteriota bacterium]
MTFPIDGIRMPPAGSTRAGGDESVIISKGQTLDSIASGHNVSVEDLRKANPQIKDGADIHPGQELTIPAGTREQPRTPEMARAGGVQYEESKPNLFSELARGLPPAGGTAAGGAGMESFSVGARGLLPSIGGPNALVSPEKMLELAKTVQSVADGVQFGQELDGKLQDLQDARDKNRPASELKRKEEQLVMACEGRATKIHDRISALSKKDPLDNTDKLEMAALYTELSGIEQTLEQNLQVDTVRNKALNPENQNGVSKRLAQVEQVLQEKIGDAYK